MNNGWLHWAGIFCFVLSHWWFLNTYKQLCVCVWTERSFSLVLVLVCPSPATYSYLPFQVCIKQCVRCLTHLMLRYPCFTDVEVEAKLPTGGCADKTWVISPWVVPVIRGLPYFCAHITQEPFSFFRATTYSSPVLQTQSCGPPGTVRSRHMWTGLGVLREGQVSSHLLLVGKLSHQSVSTCWQGEIWYRWWKTFNCIKVPLKSKLSRTYVPF